MFLVFLLLVLGFYFLGVVLGIFCFCFWATPDNAQGLLLAMLKGDHMGCPPYLLYYYSSTDYALFCKASLCLGQAQRDYVISLIANMIKSLVFRIFYWGGKGSHT